MRRKERKQGHGLTSDINFMQLRDNGIKDYPTNRFPTFLSFLPICLQNKQNNRFYITIIYLDLKASILTIINSLRMESQSFHQFLLLILDMGRLLKLVQVRLEE